MAQDIHVFKYIENKRFINEDLKILTERAALISKGKLFHTYSEVLNVSNVIPFSYLSRQWQHNYRTDCNWKLQWGSVTEKSHKVTVGEKGILSQG